MFCSLLATMIAGGKELLIVLLWALFLNLATVMGEYGNIAILTLRALQNKLTSSANSPFLLLQSQLAPVAFFGKEALVQGMPALLA